MKFINPTNDYAFKRIFGNEKHPRVLIDFLNAILDFPEDQRIIEIKILNPLQAPTIEEFKETLLDIRAKDEKGQSFIVEMQVEPQESFAKRALYYTSSAYVHQLKKAEKYNRLKKVYFVGILDFIAIKSENFISNHLILDKETHKNYVKDFEFCFVELPKFNKTEAELKNIIDKWIYFIKYLGLRDYDIDYEELFQGEPAILEALEIAEFHGLSEKEREIYEYREKKQRDEIDVIQTALNKGLAKGRKEGKMEGRKEGKMEEKKEIAQKLKAAGLSHVDISHTTGLSLPEIKEL